MRRTATLSLAAAAAVALFVSVPAMRLSGAALAPFQRTIYVTVTDSKGASIPELTAADFTIKEGGKTAEIIKVEPATARMRVALMVEERLSPDGNVRQGLFEFMKRVLPTAEISLISVGLRNTTVVDYTTSGDALVGALNQLSLNPQPTSNLMEGLLEVSKQIQQ